jgi:hypothetical protein
MTDDFTHNSNLHNGMASGRSSVATGRTKLFSSHRSASEDAVGERDVAMASESTDRENEPGRGRRAAAKAARRHPVPALAESVTLRSV